MSGIELFGVTFANPWVLLLLLLIPVVSFLRGRFGGTPAVLFSSTSVLEAIGARRQSRAGDFLTALSYFALAALIVAAARPQTGRTVVHSEAEGVDIMLVLDVSRSMLAEDFSIGAERANRLEAVLEVTEKFIKERPHDRIGIMAFAGRPYLVSPMTLDHAWLIRNLDRVRIGLVEDGTAIGTAIAAASNRLREREGDGKVMVLLTDGDNNAGRIMPLTAAEAAQALGIRIYTVGAGSHGPVPFPFEDTFGRTVYRNVNMDFDEKVLQEIAALTGGEYFRATDTASLERIFTSIDDLETTEAEVRTLTLYRDLFPWFLLAGFGFLSLEILLSQTFWRRLP